MTTKSDFIIIGSGIMGLSTGIALLESNPRTKVTVIEKETRSGVHASGRNSGVLHAGFYYTPNSLKAKFCREGNIELRKLAAEFNVPVKQVGKVVVAKNESESTRLHALFERGIQNGIDLELLPESELTKFEPLARTTNNFMWSPSTAISSPVEIINALEMKFLRLGGEIEFGNSLELVEKNGEVIDSSNKREAKYFINTAGTYANKIANSLNVFTDYAMVPFLGLYRATSISRLPIRTLIYPVPHEVNPFLGVHLTMTLDGHVKIGPTAIPTLSRENYSLLEKISASDIFEISRSLLSIARGKSHSLSKLTLLELPYLYKKNLIREAGKLLNITIETKNWNLKPPGIRAQLVHLPSGKLEQDFKVLNYLNSTHVLNVVSPGWTSALPFARYVINQIEMS